jgi:small-conductance mechanosensitive channel
MKFLKSLPYALLFVAALFACLSAGTGLAQETDTSPAVPVQADDLFNRAATALEAGSVSEKTLGQLRSQLVEVRDRTADIINRGDIRAEAIAAQLNSLGPPPAEGNKEADEIAARRLELANALAEANAPVRRAGEIHGEATFYIRQVDRQLRARKLDKVFERYPSPLAPSTWSLGFQEIEQFIQRLRRDIDSELARPSVSKKLNETVPLAIGLALFGILFLTVFQHPVSRALKKFCEKRSSGVRALLLAVVYNTSFIVLPLIGALALIAVFPVLDIYPNAIRSAVYGIPAMAVFMIIANWIGHTIFAPGQSHWRLLDLDDQEARLGLRLCQGLGVFLMLEIAIEAAELDNAFGAAAISVLSVLPIALAAVLLWPLAGIIRSPGGASDQTEDVEQGTEEPEEASVKPQDSGFLLFLSLLMKGSVILALCVTLVGYVQLARVAIIPVIMTIAQLGLGFMLYHLVVVIVKTATGRKDEDATPIWLSIGLICVLTVVFAPMIALTWGAQINDIAEAWRLLTQGIQLGDIHLSLDTILVLTAVFGFGFVVTRWLQNLLKNTVLPQTRMDAGAQNALVTGIGYVGLTLAALIAVSTAGLNLSSLAVVAGALSVGIGFGLQTIVSNFVSGIILLVERPIKEGDWIEVSGQSGYVRKISVRSTRIETFDRHDVIIPNSDLISGTVTNMTLSSKTGRLIVPVGVAYGSDLEKVKAIMINAARAHSTIARYPAPVVLFIGLGDSSLDFELRCFLKDVGNVLTTKSDLYFKIYSDLGEAGVEIPFPQRDLHLRDIDRLVDAIEQKPSGRGQRKASAETDTKTQAKPVSGAET